MEDELKINYEGLLARKSEWVALAQQREVAEGMAHEVSSLKHQLAAQETQMGKLRDTNAEIAGDLQVTKEAREKLNAKLEQETARVVKCVQKKDWYSRTYKDLKAKYESLLADNDEFVRGRENLEVEIEELKDALDDVVEQQEAWDKVNNLEKQVQNYQTAEASEITSHKVPLIAVAGGLLPASLEQHPFIVFGATQTVQGFRSSAD